MNTTRTFLLAASLATGFALSATAQAAPAAGAPVAAAPAASAPAQNWQPYMSHDDGFSAQFSGPVFVRYAPVSAAAKDKVVKSTVYSQNGTRAVYMIVATENTKKVDFDGTLRSITNLSTCATMSNDTPKTKKAAQYREVSGQSCMGGKYDIGNAFLTSGKWLYQATYIVAAGADKKDAEHFLHSVAMNKVRPQASATDKVAMN